jgi:hypothetical protein
MWYYESGGQRSWMAMPILFGAFSTLPALDRWRNKDGDDDVLRGFLSLVALNSIGGWVFATELLDPIGEYLDLPNLSHAFMHVVVMYGARVYGEALKAAHSGV